MVGCDWLLPRASYSGCVDHGHRPTAELRTAEQVVMNSSRLGGELPIADMSSALCLISGTRKTKGVETRAR